MSIEQRGERIHYDDGEDQRDTFERDKDRILYSREFRRLGEVSQVVQVDENPVYHNRLTHSLKVAQVGKRLAQYHVGIFQDDEYKENGYDEDDLFERAGGLDPRVVENAALAHDIGHPPFGHPAEAKLDEKLNEKGLNGGFEGNAQTFRILNCVATHTPVHKDYDGLDLSKATLNAVLKYPWNRGNISVGDKKNKSDKWGYYETELDEYEACRETYGENAEYGGDDEMCVEAKIMDWADDLAYAVHDLADFYRAGIIPLGEVLRGETKERREFLDAFNKEKETTGHWDPVTFLDEDLHKMVEVAGSTENGSDVLKPLYTPFKATKKEKETLYFFTSSLVQRYLGVKGDTIYVDPEEHNNLYVNENLQDEVKLLKFMTERYVFNNPSLMAQQQGHRRMIDTLFEVFYKAADPDDDDIKKRLIPPPFYEEVEVIEDMQSSEERRGRVVSDIIASMTESQAVDLYQKIKGSKIGKLDDGLIE